MNKNAIIGIVAAVIILGGVALWLNFNTPNQVSNDTSTPSQNTTNTQNNTTTNTGQTNTQTEAKGTLYMSITDAAADMANVKEIAMTLDKVEVFSSAQGWVTLSTATQTFNLLDLKTKGQAVLLAKLNVPVGDYGQIRLHIVKILVTELNQLKEAKLPSHEFKMFMSTRVNGNTNTVAKVDVLADKSMHKTGTGEFIFTPVIKLDSSSDATVSVDSRNVVLQGAGTVQNSASAGMDVDGTVKQNFQVDTNAKLEINGSQIKVIVTPPSLYY